MGPCNEFGFGCSLAKTENEPFCLWYVHTFHEDNLVRKKRCYFLDVTLQALKKPTFSNVLEHVLHSRLEGGENLSHAIKNFLIFALWTKWYKDDEVKADNIGGECSTQGRIEEHIHLLVKYTKAEII